MSSKLLCIIGILGLASCHMNPANCPTPETVKLRKANAHRMRYVMAKYKEEQAASKIDYFQESPYKKKELRHIEEWDCPKPGLKHDKMVQKKAKDLQRRYAQNLKRVAKESEERTVTYTGSHADSNKP